ncbi:hypothetical protein XENORESO_011288 [Xenotaenia resolanae]|uniref:Uncharacterized protein n=1 Tax=Xenotaenia resolanae TaxID=208358 RepID=A0ABV0X2Z8_9TELE
MASHKKRDVKTKDICQGYCNSIVAKTHSWCFSELMNVPVSTTLGFLTGCLTQESKEKSEGFSKSQCALMRALERLGISINSFSMKMISNALNHNSLYGHSLCPLLKKMHVGAVQRLQQNIKTSQ